MVVCSFLPAATRMIYDMGLEHLLKGVSFECPLPAGDDKPIVVQNNRVFIADYDLFTQPSPSTLVNGIELLAACFHPALFSIPEHLKHKMVPLERVYVC